MQYNGTSQWRLRAILGAMLGQYRASYQLIVYDAVATSTFRNKFPYKVHQTLGNASKPIHIAVPHSLKYDCLVV